MKKIRQSKQFFFYLFATLSLFTFSCSHKTIVEGGMTKVDDECPYQRVMFIGSSTTSTEKGIELLDSLSAALNLEKSELAKGNASNALKARVVNITKEVGNFAVPISEEDASDYVRLSNSICTLRKDLYEGKIFTTDESRERAVEQYTNLLNAVENLKKKLE